MQSGSRHGPTVGSSLVPRDNSSPTGKYTGKYGELAGLGDGLPLLSGYDRRASACRRPWPLATTPPAWSTTQTSSPDCLSVKPDGHTGSQMPRNCSRAERSASPNRDGKLQTAVLHPEFPGKKVKAEVGSQRFLVYGKGELAELDSSHLVFTRSALVGGGGQRQRSRTAEAL